MKIYYSVLAATILLTTLSRSSSTDATLGARSEKLQLRRKLVDVPTSEVIDSNLLLAAQTLNEQKEDEHTLARAEEDEEGDEVAKGETSKTEGTEQEIATNELLATTAPSEDTLTANVADAQNTLKHETKIEDTKGDSTSAAQSLDEANPNEPNKAQDNGKEEVTPLIEVPNGEEEGDEANPSEAKSVLSTADSAAAEIEIEEEREPVSEEDSTDEDAQRSEEDESENDSSDE